MSQQSKQRRIAASLLLVVGLILACRLATGAPPAAPGVDATTVALQLHNTALALQLTQAAFPGESQAQSLTQAAPTQNTAAESPEPQPAASETQPVGTETVAPRLQFEFGTIEITYGQKLGSFPRKSEGVTYGFQGAKGDKVTIVLTSSNARPKNAYCNSVTASTAFTLKTPSSLIPATIEGMHLSSMRDYELPASGAYYVVVTCSGAGCNAYCTEADLALEKK